MAAKRKQLLALREPIDAVECFVDYLLMMLRQKTNQNELIKRLAGLLMERIKNKPVKL